MKRRSLLISAAAVIAVIVAFLIGWVSRGPSPRVSTPSQETSLVSDLERLRDGIQAERLRQHLWELTREPHVAGTPSNLRLAQRLRDQWKDWGVPDTQLVPYRVLLSHPDPQRPNTVSLIDQHGVSVFNSSLAESLADDFYNASDIIPPYNAFSAQGTPEASPVFVNYGRVEDFALLKDTLGVNVSGRITVARYGRIFRGNKVLNAQAAGAVGMILYSDPRDLAAPGVPAYPAGWNLPADGVQRGNVLLANGAGDPLTPGYPANEFAYRREIKDGVGLPTIPVHPISALDAAHILRNMGGPPPPNDDWRGDLNVSYNIGPGYSSTQSSWKVRMSVWTQNHVRPIYNVIGTIPGEVEPDRWVIVGGHRDTWVFGGIDPMTGAATLQEMARVMGGMVRSGWRPRRSLIICSWDAEEFGLLGSTEWVEDNAHLLLSRAVAYINADSALEGNFTLRVDSSPMLHQLIYNLTKMVPSPEVGDEGRSLYHTWLERSPSSTNQGFPSINKLGSGSDFEPFYQRLGITSARARYTKNKASPHSGVPAYHSGSDTFALVERHYDGRYRRQAAVARLRALLAAALAAAPLLPLSAGDYGRAMALGARALREEAPGRGVRAGPQFESLLDAIRNFSAAAEDFHARLALIDLSDSMALRMANDRLMMLERAFIDPLGLPGRPFYRHVVFAPSAHNKYSGQAFPAVYDSLFRSDGAERETRRHLATATHAVRAATRFLH